MEFKVDSAYLTDSRGNTIGHIEVVNDITTLMKEKNERMELIKGVQEVSRSLAEGSRQIADGAQILSSGSVEQASSIEQLSASVADIKEQTGQNAGVAREAANLSGEIKTFAEKGSAQMEGMMSAVKEINDAGSKIEQVIKVIDDIAFQTNILALNAAVEAARAGQAGKGFAVVAEEVRNLASKSAEAAKDSGVLISSTVEKAHLGYNIASETAVSLGQIVDGINRSTQIAQQIADSSDSQISAIEQLNSGIEQVSQIVQQNTATAQESAAASEQMSGQAAHLEELINS
jgi:methyl-accepting chemotaxis protein